MRQRGFRLTLRLRLTLLYGACFLAAGAVLLAITYGLVEQSLPSQQMIKIRGALVAPAAGAGSGQPGAGAVIVGRAPAAPAGPVLQTSPATLTDVPKALRNAAVKLQQEAQIQVSAARRSQRVALLTESGVALAIMALISIALGWLLAGRALAPLRTMNARARQITEHSLHERLALDSRDDELGDLARTFDGLLARLQRAFESQRRFVANASHELRTPITLERALVEVALADPDASLHSLRVCCERVLAAGEQQERLIEALLTLARSQSGVAAQERIDLGALAAEMTAARPSNGSGPELRCTLAPAALDGDRALIERLVANLLDNAIEHNLAAGGWATVWTGMVGDRATLRVANSGEAIPPERVEELFEPFRRLDGERIGASGRVGLGLGLSIVGAIAASHHACLRTTPLPEGGLEQAICFPPAA